MKLSPRYWEISDKFLQTRVTLSCVRALDTSAPRPRLVLLCSGPCRLVSHVSSSAGFWLGFPGNTCSKPYSATAIPPQLGPHGQASHSPASTLRSTWAVGPMPPHLSLQPSFLLVLTPRSPHGPTWLFNSSSSSTFNFLCFKHSGFCLPGWILTFTM